jgi:proline dehydrogenase
MDALDRIVARTLPIVPRSIVQRVSAPYIAGPELGDAGRVVAELNAAGKRATIDVLGEEIRTPAEAEAIAAAYRDVLTAIRDDDLDANVSIKLTALGLEVDATLCRTLVEDVVRHAGSLETFVRIDMEDSSCTDATLAVYRELREAGLDNVGIVLQAALRRTLSDVASLHDLRPPVRLCKGIYVEPPAIAFQEPKVVRRHFVACLEALLEGGCHVAVATHDEELIAATLERVEPLSRDAYELQMLLGVRESRATELAAAGHPLRVYVPFGRRWYEYSLRRLQENPAMATTIAKATLGRLVGRQA